MIREYLKKQANVWGTAGKKKDLQERALKTMLHLKVYNEKYT